MMKQCCFFMEILCCFCKKESFLPKFSIWIFISSSVANEREEGKREIYREKKKPKRDAPSYAKTPSNS